MYWTGNTFGEPPMDVNIDADTDEYAFLYLTVRDEEGREFADVTLKTLADVDEFEREVAGACARFRALLAQSTDESEPAVTGKKNPKGPR